MTDEEVVAGIRITVTDSAEDVVCRQWPEEAVMEDQIDSIAAEGQEVSDAVIT